MRICILPVLTGQNLRRGEKTTGGYFAAADRELVRRE
jgi:hypothetical protein